MDPLPEARGGRVPLILAITGGLLAGSAHVFAGPDHLAAVVPLAVDRVRSAARIGASWGVGHAVGVLALGLLGQLLQRWVDVHWLSGWSESLVGLLLVGLGAWALWRSRVLVVHAHGHEHDAVDSAGDGHAHAHVHVGDQTIGDARHADHGQHQRHVHSAFGIGALHGAAGTGHLLGVLPSLALPTSAAIAYLVSYGIAAVVSMTVFAVGIGWLVDRTGAVHRLLQVAGAAAIGVGVVWLGGTWM